MVLLRRHDFENVERGPGHVMTKHLEVDELQQSRSLLVHVGAPDLLSTFFQAFLDVFPLVALVVPQTPDKGVQVFLEHGDDVVVV